MRLQIFQALWSRHVRLRKLIAITPVKLIRSTWNFVQMCKLYIRVLWWWIIFQNFFYYTNYVIRMLNKMTTHTKWGKIAKILHVVILPAGYVGKLINQSFLIYLLWVPRDRKRLGLYQACIAGFVKNEVYAQLTRFCRKSSLEWKDFLSVVIFWEFKYLILICHH